MSKYFLPLRYKQVFNKSCRFQGRENIQKCKKKWIEKT